MLKGKVALVTGAARGIGRAICENFADCGADIAFFYASNDSAAEECKASVEARGVKCRAYKCDVSDYHAVEEAFKSVVTEFGTVDILVNNAGITRDRLVLAMKEQDFDDVIAVNLKGAFNLIKQVYPVLARKRSGRIINISSVAGLCGNPGQLNYSASKAGLIAMTKTVAKELAARGVTCNAINLSLFHCVHQYMHIRRFPHRWTDLHCGIDPQKSDTSPHPLPSQVYDNSDRFQTVPIPAAQNRLPVPCNSM